MKFIGVDAVLLQLPPVPQLLHPEKQEDQDDQSNRANRNQIHIQPPLTSCSIRFRDSTESRKSQRSIVSTRLPAASEMCSTRTQQRTQLATSFPIPLARTICETQTS